MSGIDPKVDYAFKKLLGSENSAELLISFLNAVLDPRPHRIEHVEILNPFQPQETDLDKLSVLDVKARDQAGQLYNIEMQLLNSGWLASRILYYWARLFEDQLESGHEYGELRPAISVCICDFTLFPQSARHHCEFRLREMVEGFTFSENLEIHTLELEKFRSAEQLLDSDLDCWLYFLRNAANWNPGELPALLNRPVFQRATGVLEMIQQNRYEHEMYEARRKAWLDANSRQREYERALQALQAAQEATAKALDEGRAEGENRGALKGQITLLQQWTGQPASAAAELDQLSLTELQLRLNQLKVTWAAQSKSK